MVVRQELQTLITLLSLSLSLSLIMCVLFIVVVFIIASHNIFNFLLLYWFLYYKLIN